jgi:hypothetical protein
MGLEPLISYRKKFVITIVAATLTLMPGVATANITLAEYMTLRAEAKSGSKGAEARWRYYIIGLMDGIQAVQAPATSAGAELHFCMPDDLPISPRFLDEFLQEAIGRLSAKGQLRKRIKEPMAVIVALELRNAFPCE